MKKRVITGLMTALVIGSLAGCGAGQKETVESTAPATMTETYLSESYFAGWIRIER